MMADDYQSVLANALQRLETLKSHVKATQIEQERKESLLRQLQSRLEELQEQKESVSQQIREVNADTAMIINELRVFEELEMLDCMLSEKNTQLFLKQNEHEALLQQLANMETALGAPRRRHKTSKEDYYDNYNDNNNDNSSDDDESDWRYCCDYFFSQVESMNRYSLLQTSHLGSHPVSVFQQSVRKMYRTAREREEELAIQFNYVDTQLDQVSSLDDTLRGLENNYKREVERLEHENKERIQTMNKIGATETLNLRKELKKVVDAHHDLMEGLKARGILHVDGKLLSTPLVNVSDTFFSKSANRINVSQYDSTNDNSEDTYKSELRSAVVLQQSHPRKKNVDLNGTNIAPVVPPLPSNDIDNDDNNSNSNSNINTYNEVNRPIGIDANSTSNILDSEIVELMSQVAAAERDAHRLEQGYETLKEEASRSRSEDETKRKDMEARLSEAKNALLMLKKEKSEWESLQKQMSSLLQ